MGHNNTGVNPPEGATCHECHEPIVGGHMQDWMYCNRGSRGDTCVCRKCVDIHMLGHQLSRDLGSFELYFLYDAEYLMDRITEAQWHRKNF